MSSSSTVAGGAGSTTARASSSSTALWRRSAEQEGGSDGGKGGDGDGRPDGSTQPVGEHLLHRVARRLLAIGPGRGRRSAPRPSPIRLRSARHRGARRAQWRRSITPLAVDRGQDRAEDGDAEGAADLARGVVDCGPRAGLLGRKSIHDQLRARGRR